MPWNIIKMQMARIRLTAQTRTGRIFGPTATLYTHGPAVLASTLFNRHSLLPSSSMQQSRGIIHVAPLLGVFGAKTLAALLLKKVLVVKFIQAQGGIKPTFQLLHKLNLDMREHKIIPGDKGKAFHETIKTSLTALEQQVEKATELLDQADLIHKFLKGKEVSEFSRWVMASMPHELFNVLREDEKLKEFYKRVQDLKPKGGG